LLGVYKVGDKVIVRVIPGLFDIVKKIIILMKTEILSFFVLLGIMRIMVIFTPEVATMITIYGSAFLITIAILKVLVGLKTPLIKYLPKPKAERLDSWANNNEYSVKLSNQFNMKRRISMSNVLSYIKSLLVFIFKTNPFTFGSNSVVLYAYYFLSEELLFKNNYIFTQEVILTFLIHTAVLLSILLGINGPGMESLRKWIYRINNKKLIKIINKIKKYNVEKDKDLINVYVEKGISILNILKPFLKESVFGNYQNIFDSTTTKVKRYEAMVIANRRKMEDELLREVKLINIEPLTQQPIKTAKQNNNSYIVDYKLEK